MPPKQQQQSQKQSRRSRRRNRNRVPLSPGYMIARQNVKRDLRDSNVIAEMIALPAERKVRLPTQHFPHVAVAGLHHIKELDTVNAQFFEHSPNDFLTIAIGQPGRTHYLSPVPIEVGTYEAVFQAGNTTSNLWQPCTDDYQPLTGKGSVAVDEWWPLVRVNHIAGGMFSGQKQRAIGQAADVPFVFMTDGEIMAINGTKPVAGVEFEMELVRYNGPGKPYETVSSAIIDNTLPTYDHLFKGYPAGYYALRCANLTVSAGVPANYSYSLGIRFASATLSYARQYYYAPELDMDVALGQSVRRTAMSLLTTNTMSAMYRGGRVYGARLPLTLPHKVVHSDVVVAANVYSGEAGKGCYTYMELGITDESFDTAVNEAGGIVFPLAPEEVDMVNVISYNLASASIEVPTFMIRADMVLEFKTQSQRYMVGPSNLERYHLDRAYKIIASTPFFYENPLHMTDILGYIYKAWNATRRHANEIANAISFVAPEAAPYVQLAAKVLQK